MESDGNPFAASATAAEPVDNKRTLKAILMYAVVALVWGVAAMGSLKIHTLQGQLFDAHTLCGKWGCAPPIEALAGYHGFWLVLLLPPAILLFTLLPAKIATNLARLTCWGGLALTIGYFAWTTIEWGLTSNEYVRQYAIQHGLTRVVSLVDVPMIQTAIVGLIGLIICRVRRRRAADVNSEINDLAHRDALGRPS